MERLHNLLRDARERRWLDRPEKVRRESGRRRIKKATRRTRTVQVREPHTRRRARHGGEREILEEDAVGEEACLQERSRGHHAPRDVEKRRGRRRVPA